MLKEVSGVDISKNTTFDKEEVLEMRLDATDRRSIAVRRGVKRIRHIAPNIVGTEDQTRRESYNHDNPWSNDPGRSWNQTP